MSQIYNEGETVYDLEFIEGGFRYSDDHDKTLLFKDIIAIKIVTTDEGPWLPDVFWVIRTSEATITIEGDAPFFPIILVLLQKIPGFDNDIVIKAMQSTDYAEFIAYRK